VPARLGLVEGYLLRHRLDDALREIAEIRAQKPALELSRTNESELLVAEVAAHLSKNDLPGGEEAVRRATSHSPNSPELLAAATKVYMNFQCYSNALETVDEQLKLTPDNATALFNRGCACLQLKDYPQAIQSLSRVVNLGTNNIEIYDLALFVRARAYLGGNQLDKAETDFQTLQKAHPGAFQPYYGLGEVAYQRQDTNTAVQYYKHALANTPTNSVEANAIITRLRDLQPGTF
jgi:tetratricopeptide (TPR) repeat protein